MNKIQDILDKYKSFGDATIEKFEFLIGTELSETTSLIIYIECFNWQTEKWEKVKFTFGKILEFRFYQNQKIQNSVIFEALLKQINDSILVDFFPIQIDGLGKLEEDPNSSFSLSCKEIDFKVLI